MKCKLRYISYIIFLFFISINVHGQTFTDLKTKGDEFYNKKNWNEAIRYYESANKINPDEYCRNQIAKCKAGIRRDADYKFGNLRQRGDEDYKLKFFSEAKRYYQEALKLKKDEYCTNQSIECDCWLSLEAGDIFSAENLYKQFEIKNRKIEIELLLGERYYKSKNDLKATEWFKKAADGGNKVAMKNLATILIKYGKDDALAIDWLNKSGENSAPYYKIIGDRIWNSAGMQISKYEDAILNYKKSSLSQKELKDKYNEFGDLLNKMGKTEDANLWYALGGNDLRVRTFEQGIKHEGYNRYNQAEEAYLKAATGGYLEAYKKLGDLYWNGFSENAKSGNKYILALNFYEKANIPNLNEMYLKAGMLYVGDKATVKDAEQIFLKITKQSLKDDKTAQAYYYLGILYFEGDKGLKKDDTKAEIYLKSSAEIGHIAAQKKLTDFYIRKKKYSEAFQWFSSLDKQNEPYGTYGMGSILYSGLVKNIKNHQEEGVKLIIKAAEMGYKEALNSLYTLSEEYPIAKEAYNRISLNKKN